MFFLWFSSLSLFIASGFCAFPTFDGDLTVVKNGRTFSHNPLEIIDLDPDPISESLLSKDQQLCNDERSMLHALGTPYTPPTPQQPFEHWRKSPVVSEASRGGFPHYPSKHGQFFREVASPGNTPEALQGQGQEFHGYTGYTQEKITPSGLPQPDVNQNQGYDKDHVLNFFKDKEYSIYDSMSELYRNHRACAKSSMARFLNARRSRLKRQREEALNPVIGTYEELAPGTSMGSVPLPLPSKQPPNKLRRIVTSEGVSRSKSY